MFCIFYSFLFSVLRAELCVDNKFREMDFVLFDDYRRAGECFNYTFPQFVRWIRPVYQGILSGSGFWFKNCNTSAGFGIKFLNDQEPINALIILFHNLCVGSRQCIRAYYPDPDFDLTVIPQWDVGSNCWMIRIRIIILFHNLCVGSGQCIRIWNLI